jgi:NAD+ synthase
MPYRTSAPSSYADAQTVIDDLQLPTATVEITDMADALITRFPHMSNLRKGNIMARSRMVVLYDQSVEWGAW